MNTLEWLISKTFQKRIHFKNLYYFLSFFQLSQFGNLKVNNIRKPFFLKFFIPSHSNKCGNQDELGLTDLAVEHCPHDGVEGALGDEVVDVDRGRLADAVCPVLCLLHVPWIPVEFSEHHVACCRQGQTLQVKKETHRHTKHTILL